MYKNLVFTALFLIANASLASKARLVSLQSQYQFLDTEQIFLFPTKLSELDPFLAIEAGQMTPLKVNEAAYAVASSALDQNSTVGVAVGRQSSIFGEQKEFYNQVTTETFSLAQNPVHLLWSSKKDGDSFALKLFHSSFKNKTTQDAENSLALGIGTRIFGYMSLSLDYGLFNRTVLAGNKVLDINHALAGALMFGGGLVAFFKGRGFSGQTNKHRHGSQFY